MKAISPKNGLILGLSLLFLPIFFPEKFFFNSFVPHFYKILTISGILSTSYFLSQLLKIRFRNFLIGAALVEGVIFLLILSVKNEVDFPKPIENYFKNFYMSSMRNAPPYHQELGQYDPELFYKLNPGDHQFSNLEFKTDFLVNSFGLRDDEASLQFPKIACLGDSFTMGWGVEQANSFPEIIEQKTKSKTLNMGIPSFGTAREFLFLKKINLDSCKLLLLQFCENDRSENRIFVDNNFSLPISSKEKYCSAQRANHLQSCYYPFKFSFEITAKTIRSLFGFSKKNKNEIQKNTEHDLDDFFKIVDLIQEIYDGKIVIFNLESYKTNDSYFKKFNSFLEKNPRDNIVFFDASKVLDKNDYFIVDDHLNAKGHEKIADGILNFLEKGNQLSASN